MVDENIEVNYLAVMGIIDAKLIPCPKPSSSASLWIRSRMQKNSKYVLIKLFWFDLIRCDLRLYHSRSLCGVHLYSIDVPTHKINIYTEEYIFDINRNQLVKRYLACDCSMSHWTRFLSHHFSLMSPFPLDYNRQLHNPINTEHDAST